MHGALALGVDGMPPRLNLRDFKVSQTQKKNLCRKSYSHKANTCKLEVQAAGPLVKTFQLQAVPYNVCQKQNHKKLPLTT